MDRLTRTSMLGLAQMYSTQTALVFPCGNGGTNVKRPLVAGGHLSATNDIYRVNALWSAGNSEALVGLPCSANHIIVVDCDRHGDGDGVDCIERLFQINNFNAIRHVPVVATPNAGRHYYFESPPDHQRLKGKLGPAIDIKLNGYVIAPGSIMRDGREYSLLNGVPSDLAAAIKHRALPPLPIWLHQMITVQEANASSTMSANYNVYARLKGLVCKVATAPEGERNATLFWAACRMSEMVVKRELPREDAIALLDKAGAYAGLSQRDVAATIRSGFSR
ncbi:hypothetical protein GAO09_07740 [Rhizobiales bacterium RZME27]|uniref:DNA primase n=1 Tax=Endobacterium cereale TaxID=2663029 RepID=A0A6A8A4Z6_9HYPH|nr:bifunctional DNA primase/polymerase [Endobacterium cereale]MQY45949.1 hypothetical protein [Endobacterium cereale]